MDDKGMQHKDLWKNIMQGDSQAFEALYRAHSASLLSYGYRMTPDKQLVEDSLQDLFVELWQKRSKLGEIKSVKAYLTVSLRRKIIKAIAKGVRKIGREEAEDYHFEAELAIEDLLIQKEVEGEQIEKLRLALQQLSSRQREALYLKYQMGMDYEEICESLDLNYQSARNLVSRGLAKLKNILLCLTAVFFDFFLSY